MNALLLPVARDHRTFVYASAAVGGAFWLGGVYELRLSWGPAWLLLASLVLAPLTLALVATPARLRRQPFGWPWAYRLLLPAGLLLLVSFAFPAGIAAATLAAPWCLWTCLIAGLGLWHRWEHGRDASEEMSLDVGCIYLSIGGFWTVVARLGARPLDFSDVIVGATAVHFHYAGFILPVLTGLAGRRLRNAASRAACLGLALGVPLVAVGITLSAFGVRVVELLAASFLVAAGLLAAGCQLLAALRCPCWPGRLLGTVSACGLATALLLAAAYALGSYTGANWLDIPQMLAFHGTLNALGFALPGLLAQTLGNDRMTE